MPHIAHSGLLALMISSGRALFDCPLITDLTRQMSMNAVDVQTPSSTKQILSMPRRLLRERVSDARLARIARDAATELGPGNQAVASWSTTVTRFGVDGRGPKSFLVNPLVRWPSEVAKVRAAHEALPFYGEEFMED
ncbi:hypothetical protein B0H13DRAFT_2309488 [Mycena leptocephala]|nr:hypothetical protein B0H13DRAFT_2309488 [Mycena leptocephala]